VDQLRATRGPDDVGRVRLAVRDHPWPAVGADLVHQGVEQPQARADLWFGASQRLPGAFRVRARRPCPVQLSERRLDLWSAGEQEVLPVGDLGDLDRSLVEPFDEAARRITVSLRWVAAEVACTALEKWKDGHGERVAQSPERAAGDVRDRRDHEIQTAVPQTACRLEGCAETREGRLLVPAPADPRQVVDGDEAAAARWIGGHPVVAAESDGRVLDGGGLEPPAGSQGGHQVFAPEMRGRRVQRKGLVAGGFGDRQMNLGRTGPVALVHRYREDPMRQQRLGTLGVHGAWQSELTLERADVPLVLQVVLLLLGVTCFRVD